VQAALVEALCAAGARPDGVDDDGLPLWTAIVWGYQEAVDALVRGARVDNLVFAAGRAIFRGCATSSTGALRRAKRGAHGAHGRVLEAARTLEYATVYAAGLGGATWWNCCSRGAGAVLPRASLWGDRARRGTLPARRGGAAVRNPEVVALLERAQ